MPRRASFAVLFAAIAMVAARPQARVVTMGVDELKPGMTGLGRTVFTGDRIEEFRVNILGVIKNVLGPRRDLIIAKLEGGPLAETGVIAGMSGSPVYVDGKLIGAVSYALGSFSKEPFAGITPIAEMIDAVSNGGPRPTREGLGLRWPATTAEVYAALSHLVDRATAPLSTDPGADGLASASPLGAIAARLRPIGAAMVLGGFDPSVGVPLARALGADPASTTGTGRDQIPGAADQTPAAFQPGDPLGVSLVRGDLEIAATGTVTAVDGTRVYAFGHPFLELGPTAFPMTRANIIGVIPSLDASLKIATLGQVVGTVTQDRATAIGGTVGAGPKELAIHLTLSSEHGPDRQFTFYVVHDPILTPVFAYTAVINTLTAYERQLGVLSIAVTGALSFGSDGQVTIDDAFSGDTALPSAATAAALPLALAATNEFRTVSPETLDLRLRTSEREDSLTIERAWLDTTMPRPGATLGIQVLLRHYRGETETVSIPVTMPSEASGPLTLLVSDAATLASLEEHEVNPAKPANFAEMLTELNSVRRSNRLYIRLLTSSPGTVVGGQTLPTLPSSVQSVFESDKSISTAALTRAVVGAWDKRFETIVKGSREIPITLVAR